MSILVAILILLVVILIAYGLNKIWYGAKCSQLCVYSHSEKGLNYPWLSDIHGGLVKIQYEEPVGAGTWNDYTDHIWDIHCRVVDHSAKGLVADHMRAFVNPDTRFARLMFHFADGTAMEPTQDFYEREAAWLGARQATGCRQN